ncbi:MAG: thermonuclease family protein [Victivallales bacterium]|nr:thermonuclease family protein [Victivallales bacterium]
MRKSIVCTILFCLILTAFGDVLEGLVVKVSDGDTITVLDASKTQHRVRLNGIDAPESHQAFGRVSRHALSELVANRKVRVEYSKKDQYGRILGDVFVGTLAVNLEMVKRGMAWHYVHFAKDNMELARAEAEARRQKLGLWVEPNPIPPWDFRRTKKQDSNNKPTSKVAP